MENACDYFEQSLEIEKNWTTENSKQILDLLDKLILVYKLKGDLFKASEYTE